MHRILSLAALAMTPLALTAAPALAQEVPPGVEVDRIGIAPGETVTFTLADGHDHQLLRIKNQGEAAVAEMLATGEIRVSMNAGTTAPVLTVENRTGHAISYSILADFDGNGGFVPVAEQTAVDGASQDYRFERAAAMVNVGDFRPGPHGDTPHPPATE